MIVDASVAFKWIFVEEGSEAATALVGQDDLIAPTLLLAEIGNALWKKHRRGEITDAAMLPAQLALVASLVRPIEHAELVPRALELAVQFDHAIYDCIYLAVAEAERDVLVSADVAFVQKIAGSPLGSFIRPL